MILSPPLIVPVEVDEAVLGGLGKYPCPPDDEADGLVAGAFEEKNEGRY